VISKQRFQTLIDTAEQLRAEVEHLRRVAERGERCVQHSQPGEPLFTLVGRDVTAPAIIRVWAMQAAAAGAPAAKVGKALHDALAFERWQRQHGSKVPD
jgi:hypothetical protein